MNLDTFYFMNNFICSVFCNFVIYEIWSLLPNLFYFICKYNENIY